VVKNRLRVNRGPELLHQTQQVSLFPNLGDLVIGYAINRDLAE